MKIPSIIFKMFTALMTTFFRYVLIVVAVTIILIGYLTFLRPQFEKVRETGILAFQSESERYTDRLQYYTKVQEMVDKYRLVLKQKKVDEKTILPHKPEVENLFLIFQAIAQASGMNLETVAIVKGGSLATVAPDGTTSASTQGRQTGSAGAATKTTSATSTLQVLNITVTMSGINAYENFKNLLKNLESSQRIFDIPSVSYTSSATASQDPNQQATTQYSFEMKSYYLEVAEKK